MKKLFWKIAGLASLLFAYIGLVTPGIPWSIFVVFAGYAFAKSSPELERKLYSHRIFGPFLVNWVTKQVFPMPARFFMIATMVISLIIMYISLPLWAVGCSGALMFAVAVWAWRYPATEAEYFKRKDSGKKIGWFK